MIQAEYQTRSGGPRFDISSAGRGFQQVLMLLAFLNTRPATVLLLDEPDAHLHLILRFPVCERLDHLQRTCYRNASQKRFSISAPHHAVWGTKWLPSDRFWLRALPD